MTRKAREMRDYTPAVMATAPDPDPDMTLIMSYIRNELPPEERTAFEHRMQVDEAFRELAEPLIWFCANSYRRAHPGQDRKPFRVLQGTATAVAPGPRNPRIRLTRRAELRGRRLAWLVRAAAIVALAAPATAGVIGVRVAMARRGGEAPHALASTARPPASRGVLAQPATAHTPQATAPTSPMRESSAAHRTPAPTPAVVPPTMDALHEAPTYMASTPTDTSRSIRIAATPACIPISPRAALARELAQAAGDSAAREANRRMGGASWSEIWRSVSIRARGVSPEASDPRGSTGASAPLAGATDHAGPARKTADSATAPASASGTPCDRVGAGIANERRNP